MAPGVCNRNAILSGLIDYYCLVCEDLFQNVEDVHQHVDTPHHNKILQQTYYVNEYTEHRIRKLRKGYFCEYCNEAFTTSSKMRSHVDSETHVYRRNSKQFSSSRSVLNLSWSGNRVLTSQLLIDERPWNGILDDNTCLVCDEEIDSFEDHKKIWSHVLKLAQTKILVGKDELSRQIKDSLYQCLICNTMCPINDYDKHNTTESHIMNYTKAIQSTPVSTVVSDNDDVGQTSNNNNDCKGKEEGNMIENDTKVTINNEKNAKPKTEPKQDSADQKPSKKNQNNQQVSFDDGGDVAKSFAKVNDMTYDEGVNTATCNICKVKVPFYLKSMKEHVNGNLHKKNSKADKVSNEKKFAKKTEKVGTGSGCNNKRNVKDIKPYKTVPYGDFNTREIMKTNNSTDESVELVINQKIYLKVFPNYVMITRDEDDDEYKCNLCNKTLANVSDLERHMKSDIVINGVTTQHDTALKDVLVISDFEDQTEFVREVRPSEFHCGYCNIMVSGWGELNFHLNTMIHYRMKLEGGWKVEQIKQESDRHQELKAIRFMHLLNML